MESKGKAVKQEGELAKWRAVEKGEVFDYRGEWNRDRSKWEGIGQILTFGAENSSKLKRVEIKI